MMSPTGYVQAIESSPGSYPYSAVAPLSPYAASQYAFPALEYIPHRVFVGGLSPGNTKEDDLRKLFQAYGYVREVKVIKNTEGVSKGYGFVTFETEEEANRVRNLNPETLKIRGKKLNLGPAVRRMGIPRFGMTDFKGGAGGATNGQYWPAYGYAYAYPNSQPFFVYSPNQMMFPQTGASTVSPPNSPSPTLGSTNGNASAGLVF